MYEFVGRKVTTKKFFAKTKSALFYLTPYFDNRLNNSYLIGVKNKKI